MLFWFSQGQIERYRGRERDRILILLNSYYFQYELNIITPNPHVEALAFSVTVYRDRDYKETKLDEDGALV